ncbi:Rieske (2Fe-2S) iron-sulfur domain protein [Mycolicibacterium rhodesiae JS60]|nr:Rieske (2Fe-2S) iron-sulfur domain protein [Mycolicibacterium rhodesiae JS60]
MSEPESGAVIARLEDVPMGEGRTFTVDGQQIAVFRLRNGSLRALGAVCPHRGGPLADGLIDDEVVVCPLHGYAFDMSSGVEVSGTGMSAPVFPVSAIDGKVCLQSQNQP